jgi:hypothetical protein
MVSCDVVGIPDELLGLVRQEVLKQLPELDVRKLFLNATHTHRARDKVFGRCDLCPAIE